MKQSSSRVIAALTLGAAAVALALAGCGGEGSSTSGSPLSSGPDSNGNPLPNPWTAGAGNLGGGTTSTSPPPGGQFKGSGVFTAGPDATATNSGFGIVDLHKVTSGGTPSVAASLFVGSQLPISVAGVLPGGGNWVLTGFASDGTTWTVNVSTRTGIPVDATVTGSNGDTGSTTLRAY